MLFCFFVFSKRCSFHFCVSCFFVLFILSGFFFFRFIVYVLLVLCFFVFFMFVFCFLVSFFVIYSVLLCLCVWLISDWNAHLCNMQFFVWLVIFDAFWVQRSCCARTRVQQLVFFVRHYCLKALFSCHKHYSFSFIWWTLSPSPLVCIFYFMKKICDKITYIIW